LLNRLGGHAQESVMDSLQRLKRGAEMWGRQVKLGKADNGTA